ncbi:MAG: TerC family protein [Polyangiales bacterium]
MLELVTDPQAWVALLTLTGLEIVLGVDNVVFIAIIAGRVPLEQRNVAYRLGLMGAMVTRVLLLFTLSWLMALTKPFLTVFGEEISGRDLILIVGGLFLMWKSSHEIYAKVELKDELGAHPGARAKFVSVVVQIMLLDIVFSLDSVITAVGMVDDLPIMVAAIVLAVGVMLLFAKRIGEFVNDNPSVKILALSFLLLIGVLLLADGLDRHIPKGYVYFAMAYALGVEIVNLRWRKNVERKSRIPDVPTGV